jgi:hypothetical protein
MERWISTIWQVVIAVAVVWPAAVAAVGAPMDAAGWILGLAAGLTVLVNGVQNVLVRLFPGKRRVLRTVIAVTVAVAGAAPAAVAAVGEPTSTTGWITGLFAAVVVVQSAVRNRGAR